MITKTEALSPGRVLLASAARTESPGESESCKSRAVVERAIRLSKRWRGTWEGSRTAFDSDCANGS